MKEEKVRRYYTIPEAMALLGLRNRNSFRGRLLEKEIGYQKNASDRRTKLIDADEFDAAFAGEARRPAPTPKRHEI